MSTRHLRSGRELALFSTSSREVSGEAIVSIDGDVRLYRGWLARRRADAVLAHVRETTLWVRERRKMYDRFVDVPREQAWRGDDRDLPFTPPLDEIRRELQTMLETAFSYVLLNRYRDGKDSVAWHNDRAVGGTLRRTIASLTLGATRAFDLRPKADPKRIVSIDVDHGDLIVMRGDTQINFDHRVRKDPKIADERINLTFRQHGE